MSAAPAAFAPGAPGALEGVRIVDLTQMLAGPFCTQMLADQGADVVKVEPLDGDHTRTTGPFRADDSLKAFGGYFASVNRNKRSIGIDLKQPRGRELLLRLTDGAHALVENYRAGVMDRLGLSYETLRARNPKLVYAAIRGFGDPRTGKSPYMDWPAYDVIAQAMGGIMGITGPDERTPIKVGPGVGDIMPAAMCAFGVVCAIHRAGRTGEGQFVDVSMLDSVLSLCERIVYQHAFQGADPHPEGNRHPLIAPFGMFPAQDGWVTIAAHTDEWFAVLARLMGREDLIGDARSCTSEARVANRDFVYAEVGAFTKARSKRELAALFGGKIPFGPVYHVREIAADPHFKAREMIVEVEHPGCSTPAAVAGVPVKMSATPGRIRRRAPLLGEDTAAILAEAGLPSAEIARYRAENVIV
jgi:crotonobetainyl-CoA:carnitine CoA-transferase CaiB-like acyl-CoA transferase